MKKGFEFVKDLKKVSEFQSAFPYAYTDDQQTAIDEIFEDMSLAHPMDRLLNGDVGFGKTEVCFNAIFNAYCNKKQSILLTPLVVLAYEHYDKALERFSDFGMKI
jgi:transcription-repair coupling factor (superfamily II helicase)